MNINPIGMLKSENIDGMNVYISGIRRGADAIVWDTETGNMLIGEVKYIVKMWDYESEFIFRDEYGSYDHGRSREFDFFLPFFADDDDYYAGIDIRPECKDTHNVQSCRNYMRLAEETTVEDDGSFAKHEVERKRHKMHREIKHRMYAERIARQKAKKGA